MQHVVIGLKTKCKPVAKLNKVASFLVKMYQLDTTMLLYCTLNLKYTCCCCFTFCSKYTHLGCHTFLIHDGYVPCLNLLIVRVQNLTKYVPTIKIIVIRPLWLPVMEIVSMSVNRKSPYSLSRHSVVTSWTIVEIIGPKGISIAPCKPMITRL